MAANESQTANGSTSPPTNEARATIYDVARVAGVSIGTVSRVLNKRKDVAAATRERVLEAVKEVRYMPMQTTRRVTLGLVMQEIQEVHEAGYIGKVLVELTNHAARKGALLEVIPVDDIERIHANYIQGLVGILFGESTAFISDITHIPVCLINNLAERHRFHTVSTDHAEGAYMGTKHLLDHGHRRIALVQIETADWGSRERERGYRRAHSEARADVEEDLIVYLEDWSIQDAFDPILAREPTALFIGGEDLSVAITSDLVNRLHVKIPEELSLVTYEVPVLSSMVPPPQTTIAQPWAEMARAALDILLDVIESPTDEIRHREFSNRLIERASVRDLR